MIDVTNHPEGAVLPVRARPGARKNGLVDEHGGALRVAVTAPPVDGRANEALVEVLAETLNLRKSQFVLLAGETSRVKRFLVRGVNADDLLSRIDGVLTPTVFEPQDPDV
jgi:uncharacterized protein (TIGR00251 family)